MMLKTVLVDSRGRPWHPVDEEGALTSILQAHHWIHMGRHFFVEDFDEINDTDTIEFCLEIGDIECHMLWQIESQLEIQMDYYESPIITWDQAEIPPQNSKRGSGIVSSMRHLQRDATIVDDGNRLGGFHVGSATVPASRSLGGSYTRESELVLFEHTTYLFRLTSFADNNYITFNGSWYEPVPRREE